MGVSLWYYILMININCAVKTRSAHSAHSAHESPFNDIIQ